MPDQVPKIVTYALQIEREKLDRLKEIASRDHRTLPGEIRRMVDERIAQHEEPAA